MEFSGTYLFFDDRQTIWRALNDTKTLKKAIPGCDSIEWNSPTQLDLIIKVNLGIMHPKFAGELELSDIEEAQQYVLSGRGRGGLLGLAHGSARITLKDHNIKRADIDYLHDQWREQMERNGAPESQFELDAQKGDAGTMLSFEAVGGASKQLMALGHSIIGKSAQGIIDKFMGRFSRAMDIPMRPKNEKNKLQEDKVTG